MPPVSGLRGQGTSPGSPAGFLSLSGWGKHPPLLFCFFILEGPSCLPLLIFPASLLCLQDQPGLEGTSEGVQPSQIAGADFPGRLGRGNAGATPPDLSPRGVLQAWEPPLFQPPLRGAGPVWPSLLLPPLVPHILQVCLGGLPLSLGVQVPTSVRQAP